MNRYDWLEQQLDREDLSDEDFDRYNAELNDLQSQVNAANDRVKQARITKQLAQCRHIELLHKEGRMAELVDYYGKQFIHEYTITDNHAVISSVSRDRNPNQQNVWEHTCHEDAVRKLHELLYYRVYDHYFREREGGT